MDLGGRKYVQMIVVEVDNFLKNILNQVLIQYAYSMPSNRSQRYKNMGSSELRKAPILPIESLLFEIRYICVHLQ
jgi:hypothetical protein